MEFDHLLSVAALVEDEEGRVLMLRSPDRGWEYPGGMVEPGETLQQALHREIFEETGVSVEIISLAGVSKNMSRNIVNVDFRCRYTGGVLTTSPESLEVRWMTREEILRLFREGEMVSVIKDLTYFMEDRDHLFG